VVQVGPTPTTLSQMGMSLSRVTSVQFSKPNSSHGSLTPVLVESDRVDGLEAAEAGKPSSPIHVTHQTYNGKPLSRGRIVPTYSVRIRSIPIVRHGDRARAPYTSEPNPAKEGISSDQSDSPRV
jgi:hypothetical protein